MNWPWWRDAALAAAGAVVVVVIACEVLGGLARGWLAAQQRRWEADQVAEATYQRTRDAWLKRRAEQRAAEDVERAHEALPEPPPIGSKWSAMPGERPHPSRSSYATLAELLGDVVDDD